MPLEIANVTVARRAEQPTHRASTVVVIDAQAVVLRRPLTHGALPPLLLQQPLVITRSHPIPDQERAAIGTTTVRRGATRVGAELLPTATASFPRQELLVARCASSPLAAARIGRRCVNKVAERVRLKTVTTRGAAKHLTLPSRRACAERAKAVGARALVLAVFALAHCPLNVGHFFLGAFALSLSQPCGKRSLLF
jgi:hypothetical protein